MENAAKALIISAAVLIVIVLIAVGLLLLGNVSDTSKQAQTVGNSLYSATGNVVSDITGIMKELPKLAEVANIGDIVEYTPGGSAYNQEGADYKFIAKDNEVKWKIFKIDSDGYVYLISTSPVGMLTLTGTSAVGKLELICKEYVNTEFAQDGRAPKKSDIESENFSHDYIFWTSTTVGWDQVEAYFYYEYDGIYYWNKNSVAKQELFCEMWGNGWGTWNISQTYRSLPSYKTKTSEF